MAGIVPVRLPPGTPGRAGDVFMDTHNIIYLIWSESIKANFRVDHAVHAAPYLELRKFAFARLMSSSHYPLGDGAITGEGNVWYQPLSTVLYFYIINVYI